jgi:hypothetical protein
MSLDSICLFLLMLPPVLWMMYNSYSRYGLNSFLLKVLGAAVLVPAFCAPDIVLQKSTGTAYMLTDALASLSETDLRKYSYRHEPRGEPSEGVKALSPVSAICIINHT